MHNFRKYHILQLLRQFENQSLPFDRFTHFYFRSHKAIGSKDRIAIANCVFDLIRYRELLDYLTKGNCNFEKKFQIYSDAKFTTFKNHPLLPPHIKAGQPLVFYEKLILQYGKQKGDEIANICNTEAPITIRINPLKTTRETLLEHLKGRYEVSPSKYSPLGIQFAKRINFSQMSEFKEGLFEVQDEGSQLVSFLLKAKPKDKVMDFCAGAGGKTLAFAPFLQNKGVIYLNDVRQQAIQQAKKRLARAGIYNVHFLPKCESLKDKMDWVLVDAPCSGTGTYRRNVDLKWKFSLAMLENIIKEQQSIFREAVKLVRPGGKIIYVTCSILQEENEWQIERFIKDHTLELCGQPFNSLPELNGMDGFFAATMTRPE